jgi:ABC-type transporter Mla subunit MlaD
MKRNSRTNPNELKVGLFVFIPLAIVLLFFVVKLGYSLSGSTIDVYLKIENISAIKKGTAVQLKGYDIGRVVELTPVFRPSLHFLATMRIKKDIDLHEDCSAIIMNQNIIGDTVVELRNPERKGEPLRDLDVIEGFEYVNLEAILQDVHKLLATITDTVNTLNLISNESRANIQSMTSNLNSSMESLNKILTSSENDIISTVKTFRETSETIQEISLELKKRPFGFIMRGSEDKK